MKISLLDSIKEISAYNISFVYITKINNLIHNKLFWLESKEPDSDGSKYNEWEEKYNEWNDITDLSERIYELLKNESFLADNMNENIEKLKEMINNYQLIYGGLSRLKLEV